MLDWFFGITQALHIPNSVVYFVIFLVVVYLYSTWNYNIFKKVVGCPGPDPIPLLGTMHLYYKKGLQVDLELKKKYGRTYGVFDGVNPIFVTGDLDLIKQIAIKDFDSFVNHRRVCINYPLNKALGMIKDDDWRQQRTTTSRVVTASKLRQMSVAVDKCAKELADNLEKFADSGEMCQINLQLGYFTMDVIAQTQFAVDVHSHNEPNHPFIVHARKMFNAWFVFQPAVLLYLFFPRLLQFVENLNIKYFKIFPAESISFFTAVISNLIQRRKSTVGGPKRADFLQLLLDTQNQNQTDHDEEQEEGASELVKTADKMNERISKGMKCRPLSDMEITGASITFMLAGYETTASTLAWASYALALHPDVQEKLYEEVRKNCEVGKPIDYDVVMKMQYLDQVLNEVIRRYSVIMRTDRVCTKTCQVGPYTIPKGMCIQLSVLGVHYDEEYWPEPFKFDPDRFAPENRHRVYPNSLLTFGVGPRICLGTRFAILEMKIALAYMVSRFQILPCEKTEVPIKYAKSQLALAENGIWVTLKRRA